MPLLWLRPRRRLAKAHTRDPEWMSGATAMPRRGVGGTLDSPLHASECAIERHLGRPHGLPERLHDGSELRGRLSERRSADGIRPEDVTRGDGGSDRRHENRRSGRSREGPIDGWEHSDRVAEPAFVGTSGQGDRSAFCDKPF
jgi:hypothetical protein